MDFKQFLSNTQMGKVVVRFLKKEPTADAQGKMVLTAEEEQKLTEHFGPNFVSLLKEKTFSTEDEQANDLYEAALHHATEQVEARFTSQIKQLQTEGFQIVAATEKSRKLLYDADFRKPTALVMGAEDTGISKEVLKLCDEQLAIPLIGHIESLNVSAAAAVMLFEVVRQRIGQ